MPLPKGRITATPGFTLIELIMTIVILGFLSLVLLSFYQPIVHSPDPVIRERATALGQALMDEIMAKRWDENTPAGGGPICTVTESNDEGSRTSLLFTCTTSTDPAEWASSIGADSETRSNYDDVDDYNSMATETDTFIDQSGAIFTMSGYSRSVNVRYIASNSDPITASAPAGSTVQGQSTDSKRIVVTVTSPLNETFQFVTVVCNI